MPRKRFSVEQIINYLREADVLLEQGRTVGEVFRRIGVSEQSYYRWRKEYGGLKVGQARRLKDLEAENARLKRAVAELTLDKLILKEAAEGNFSFFTVWPALAIRLSKFRWGPPLAFLISASVAPSGLRFKFAA